MLEALLAHPLTNRLGWTLLHSLWQGLALAGAFGLGLLLLGPCRSRLRHAFSTAILLLWLAAPAVTFAVLAPAAPGAVLVAGGEFGVASLPLPTSSSQPGETATSAPADGQAAIEPTSPARVMELRRLIPYAALAWLAVALFMSLRLLGGLILTHRLRRGGTPIPALEGRLRELAERLGISRRVRLFASTRVDVPTALGWLRPVVLLPASALTGLTAAQLELILAHELAHIRRHDYLVSLLQGVGEALLFYHPLTWWVSRTLRVEREHACDNLALAATGAAPLALAESLARLEVGRALPAPALAATGHLLPRIRRLLGGGSATPGRTPALLPLLPLLALAPLVMWLAVTAQASTPNSALFERHPGGAIASPFPEAPAGGWPTFRSLSEIGASATYPLKAPTALPPGFRFSNATWDDRVELATLTYAAPDDGLAAEPFARTLTLLQMPASEYRPLPVGLEAEIEPQAIGAAAGEYVTGNWAGDWRAPEAERDLRWQPGVGQMLAWQEGDMVYAVVTDQFPAPGRQPLTRAELVRVARGLVTIDPTLDPPSASLVLPSDRTRLWATLLGDVTISPDHSEPATMGENGRVIIEERSPTLARRVIVTPASDGSYDYQYTENGAPAAFDEEARTWYWQALEAAVRAPLRAMNVSPRTSSYSFFEPVGDRYVSLVGLRSEPFYRLYLPGALEPRSERPLEASLELLAHGAAHGFIDQGTLEVALYAYLVEPGLDLWWTDVFRWAVAQLESEPARQRLLERLD